VDYSFRLTAQGSEQGHLVATAYTYTDASAVDAAEKASAGAEYARCVGEQYRTTYQNARAASVGAAKVRSFPMVAPAQGIHYHVSFPYQFGGASKTAENDTLIVVYGRMRVVMKATTCCTPWDSVFINHLTGLVDQRLHAASQ
jgi:hypothetical protein